MNLQSHLYLSWLPQAVIIDARFLIITKSLRRNKTISEYAKFPFSQFVLEHFKAGTKEVNLIFDYPSKQKFNPKQFEHARRCNESNQCSSQHEYYILTPDSNIP